MTRMGLMAGLGLAIALGGVDAACAQDARDGNPDDNRGGMAQQGMHGMMQQGMQGGLRGMRGMDRASMAARFGEADADGDGKLSRDEVVARMSERSRNRIEARADRMIARMDDDGDGMLSMGEMQSGMGGRMFDRLDADGDGAISRGEFAGMREMRDRHPGRGHGKGHAGTGHPGKGSGDVIIHHHHHYGD